MRTKKITQPVVEIDLERALEHLGGAEDGGDFMLRELRSRCGLFGASLADQIEEQQPEPKPVWTDGDVVQVVENPENVWVRGTPAWTSIADEIVNDYVQRGTYRVLRQQVAKP